MIYLKIHHRFKDKISDLNLCHIIVGCLNYFAKNPESYDCSIILAGNNRVKLLNKKYLDINAPTDVLSFSSGDLDPETGRIYLGDIIIAFNVAVDQARQANHSVETELTILVVHGFLHLMGFDHSTEQEKTQMWNHQREILKLYGVSAEIP